MDRTDRITIVSASFPPNVLGGAEVNAQLLAEYLADVGVEVEVLTGASVVPKTSKYKITVLPALRPRPSIVYEPWWNKRTALRIDAAVPRGSLVHTFDVLSRGVVAELVRDRPDLIPITTLQDVSPICGSIDGLLVDGTICRGCTLENLPLHTHLQRYRGIGRAARLIRYWSACVRPYRRTLLHRYRAVTTVSTFLKNFLSLPDATVIPDLLLPPRLACRLEQIDAPQLVTIGRVSRDKGTDLILEALAGLPAFLATFVGSGDLVAFKRRAEQLGVANRVTFAGPVPLDEVGGWYHAADVVVQASRAPEASSRTILEAMSLGKAVVGPNYAGPAELITEGSTGRLFERNNPVSLARAIERAYAERQTLGARALEVAERFHPSRVGPQYLALYEAIGTRYQAVAISAPHSVVEPFA